MIEYFTMAFTVSRVSWNILHLSMASWSSALRTETIFTQKLCYPFKNSHDVTTQTTTAAIFTVWEPQISYKYTTFSSSSRCDKTRCHSVTSGIYLWISTQYVAPESSCTTIWYTNNVIFKRCAKLLYVIRLKYMHYLQDISSPYIYTR
jgi:hypothetical protein